MSTASAFFSTPPDRITPSGEARFFGQLKTANATFKRTGHGRLDSVNDWLVDRLAAAGARVDRVLDVGISSGVTTVELCAALHAAGHDARATGTDRSFRAHLIDLSRFVRVLVEPDGHVLQYDLCGRAIKPWRRRLDYLDGMAVVRGLLHRALAARARAALAAGQGRAVWLVTPRLHADAIELVEDDVTRRNATLCGRFDLVRAANILNRHYFAEAGLRAAVANVRACLRGPGAWLLVVRTHGEAAQHGTLFRLNDAGRLDVVARCGRGSEVEDLFLE